MPRSTEHRGAWRDRHWWAASKVEMPCDLPYQVTNILFLRRTRSFGDCAFFLAGLYRDFMTLQVSSINSYSDDLRSCLCSVCKSMREYGERHTKTVRDYYSRNREDILLTKAFNRHQSGMKSRPETLEKLINTGYPVHKGQSDAQMRLGDSVAHYLAIEA
jgi:hypothetical protein